LIADSSSDAIDQAKDDEYEAHLICFDNDDDLIKIGIGSDVDILFCMSNDYNENLFITLSARNLDKNLMIVSLVSQKEQEQKILLAGANKTINSYEIGAHHIYRMIKKPAIFKTLDKIFLSEESIKIAQIAISKDSFLDGVKFQSIDIEKRFNLIIMGIENIKRKGAFIFNTKKINRKIDSNYVLVVMGHTKNIEKLKKELKR